MQGIDGAALRSDGAASAAKFELCSDPCHIGTQNDESVSGSFFLHDPSDTTFLKKVHWETAGMTGAATRESFSTRGGGYLAVTGAIDHVRFMFDTGNIDSGVIRMYGRNNS